jgi:hypothetical protein
MGGETLSRERSDALKVGACEISSRARFVVPGILCDRTRGRHYRGTPKAMRPTSQLAASEPMPGREL